VVGTFAYKLTSECVCQYHTSVDRWLHSRRGPYPLLIVPPNLRRGRAGKASYPTAPQRRPAGWRIGLQLMQEVGEAGPPGFWEDLDRLQAGDPAALEPAIRYLERDPTRFRSGYVKEDLIRYINRVSLGAGEAARLREVVLLTVDRPDRREFRRYTRLARRVDAPELREALAERLQSSDRGIRRRAKWILDALPVDD
jgi:hypothetical protein